MVYTLRLRHTFKGSLLRWRSEREREKRKVEGAKDAESKETVETKEKVKLIFKKKILYRVALFNVHNPSMIYDLSILLGEGGD